MKTFVALAAVLFAATHLLAETPPATATSPADTKVVEAKPAAPVVKAPAPAPAKKEEKAKAEKEPVIPGTTIARPNGTYLGLEVVGVNFKLSFYDKKKKPMAPDVTRALARWPNTRGSGDNRTVLNPSGNSFMGSKPVIPPFTFNVFLTLMKGDGDEAKAVENYTVPFRG